MTSTAKTRYNQKVLQSLYQISEISSQAKDLDSLWQPLFQQILQIMQVDAGTLLILEGNVLQRKVAIGLDPQIMQEPPIPLGKGISGKVAQSRKPQIISDLTREKTASAVLQQADLHSLITVPLQARGQLLGVLSIFTRQQRQFQRSDLELLSTISNQAALSILAIKSSDLLLENQRKLEQLDALNQISKSISSLFNFEETLYTTLGVMAKIFHSEKGLLTLLDFKTHLLKGVLPAFGLADNQALDFRVRTEEAISGQAFYRGIPILQNQIDSQTKEVLKRAHIFDVKSMIAAPLRVKSQTLGVLHLFSQSENNFQKVDLGLFSILTSQAAVVVNSSMMFSQIAEEKNKAEILLSSIGEGVYAVDKDLKLIFVNSAVEKLTGWLSEEVAGQRYSEVLPLLDKDKKPIAPEERPLKQVLNSGKTISRSQGYFLERRDKTSFPIAFTTAAIYNAQGKITGAIVAFRDKTAELEVEEMKKELISIATHELRAPITGMKGYLEMILEGQTGQVPAETQEVVSEVWQINENLAILVDDLLNVSRLEQGRMQFNLQPIDAAEQIEATLKTFQAQAKKKNLKLEFQKPTKPLPQILADPERYNQVLINLVSNALKYTIQGKVVVVLALDRAGRYLETQISDSGVGISGQDQKHLFEKFYRIKNAKTRQVSGTGLGLWICKQIAQRMSGKIRVRSQEGVGSTFSFNLPVVPR